MVQGYKRVLLVNPNIDGGGRQAEAGFHSIETVCQLADDRVGKAERDAE